MHETWVQSQGWKDLLEKEMTTHSSTLAWKIPWTKEPGRLQSMGLQRVRHNWATSLSLSCHNLINTNVITGEGNGTPLQYSCLENPMDGGAWWAAVCGVAKSRTRLSDFTSTFHFHVLEKEMATTPVFLPGESQGWGSLMGCHLWGRMESDTTEAT